MKRREIVEILKSTGIPVTYYQWDEDKDGDGPALPYIVYYYPSSEGEAADDRQWSQKARLNVELYTETKDFDIEEYYDKALDAMESAIENMEESLPEFKVYLKFVTPTTSSKILKLGVSLRTAWD